MDTVINISFLCENNSGIAKIAHKYLDLIQVEYEALDREWKEEMDRNEVEYDPEVMIEMDSDMQEACVYLTELSQRTGYNPGMKGGMSTYGTITKSLDTEGFIKRLTPFIREILGADDPDTDYECREGPQSFHRWVVLIQHECERAKCFSFRYERSQHKQHVRNDKLWIDETETDIDWIGLN